MKYLVKKFENRIEWWYNGQIHREDGPAIEYNNGNKFWYKEYKYHRIGGPALEYANGDKYWYFNGKLHREDGPAIELINRRDKEWWNRDKEWWLDGVRYSEVKFNERMNAKIEYEVIVEKLETSWKLNGQYHREDGPAREFKDGTKHWYRHGKTHRENGPAVEYFDGTKEWYKDGVRHRTDGPAIENLYSFREYWINGERLSEKDFEKRINFLEKEICETELRVNKIIKKNLNWLKYKKGLKNGIHTKRN